MTGVDRDGLRAAADIRADLFAIGEMPAADGNSDRYQAVRRLVLDVDPLLDALDAAVARAERAEEEAQRLRDGSANLTDTAIRLATQTGMTAQTAQIMLADAAGLVGAARERDEARAQLAAVQTAWAATRKTLERHADHGGYIGGRDSTLSVRNAIAPMEAVLAAYRPSPDTTP